MYRILIGVLLVALYLRANENSQQWAQKQRETKMNRSVATLSKPTIENAMTIKPTKNKSKKAKSFAGSSQHTG